MQKENEVFKVRVKSLEEIKETLNMRNEHKTNGLSWARTMGQYCGKTIQVQKFRNTEGMMKDRLKQKGSGIWVWHVDWVTPINVAEAKPQPIPPRAPWQEPQPIPPRAPWQEQQPPGTFKNPLIEDETKPCQTELPFKNHKELFEALLAGKMIGSEQYETYYRMIDDIVWRSSDKGGSWTVGGHLYFIKPSDWHIVKEKKTIEKDVSVNVYPAGHWGADEDNITIYCNEKRAKNSACKSALHTAIPAKLIYTIEE